MESRTYYYARVSNTDQNLDRQMKAFKSMGADDRNIITDKASGKDFERSGYQALKTTILKKGDTLVVKSLDRLSRNKADIKSELEYFKANGIRLKILDLPTTLIELPKGQDWILGNSSAVSFNFRFCIFICIKSEIKTRAERQVMS